MSLKIHLIFSPTILGDRGGSSQGELLPPLGILYIASFLRKKISDVNIKITNGLAIGLEGTLEEIKEFSADIYGISCQTANAMGAYKISETIKREYPEKLIVMGGVHPTVMPEDVLENSRADLICIGEGEETFFGIVKVFQKLRSTDKENFRNVYGIVFENKGDIIKTPQREITKNLDEFPFPAWDLIDVSRYSGGHIILSKKTPSMGILSSRGCVFECNFCANLMWRQQKPYMRRRSPANIFDEVEFLIKKYNIKEYTDSGNYFNTDLEYALEMCHEKIRRNIDVFWFPSVRAHPMENELAKKMRESNCWGVAIGVESANSETLIGIKKNINLPQFERSCEIFKKNGIKIMANFMFLHAWEKENRLYYEDIEKSLNTLNYAKNLFTDKLIDYMTWSQATPYPGSSLYNTAIKYDLIREGYVKNWEKWTHTWDFVMKLPGISIKDCQRLKNIGTLAQAKILLSNRNINLRSWKYILKRTNYFMKNLFRHGLGL